MKALDLIVYPLWFNGLDGTCYADKGNRLQPTVVDYEVYRKRLTDAELASEWQALKRNEAVWVITKDRRASEAMRRMRIIDRFATLPSYDEPTTQKVER